MHTMSAHIRRCRNIVAGEIFNLAYTAKANVVASNCIFVHIPKNAGTSITKAFDLPTSNHYTAKELQWWMGRRSFDRFFSFCIIRNPYDRFLSLYHYARLERSIHHSVYPEDQRRKHSDYELLKSASLNDCADMLVENKLSKLWNPQTDWFLDDNDEILVNYIGHYETINQDFAFLTQRMCGEVRLLPTINSSQRKVPYTEELTEYARSAVDRFYKRDFKTLNYKL